MRHGGISLVGHHVADGDARFTQPGRDASREGEVLAKDHGLAHAPAGPHLVNVLALRIPAPAAIHPGALGGQMVQPSMQAEGLPLVQRWRAGGGQAAARQ